MVKLIREARPTDPCIRLRNPITFSEGELLLSIEIYASMDDVAICQSSGYGRMESRAPVSDSSLPQAGSSWQGMDGPGMMLQPLGSLYSSYAREGARQDSYIKTFDIQAGRLSPATTISFPRSLVHRGLLLFPIHSFSGFGLERVTTSTE